MKYKLTIATETKSDVFFFEKTRYARTFDEIVDYVNELVKIYKKSAKVVILVFDENEKKTAQYSWDFGWCVF